MRGKWSRTAVAAVGLAAVTAVAVACGTEAAKQAAPNADPGAVPAADVNILVVGMDAGPGREGSRPDTIALVHVPKAGNSASIVSLPRDLYVDGKKLGRNKLNAMYSLALAAERKADPNLDQRQLTQKAQEDFVSVVQDVTGVTVDHYAQVDMAGFVELSTVVGGVPVCLKAAQHDSFSGADFPAGPQTVAGKSALAFVRQRHGLANGDLDRIKRQQAFLTSLVDVVAKSGALTDDAKRTALIGAVRKHVVLDQRWDLVSFLAQVRPLTSAKVTAGTPPVTDRFVGGMAVLVGDPKAIRAFVADSFAGKTGNGRAPGHDGSSTGKQADGAPVTCVN